MRFRRKYKSGLKWCNVHIALVFIALCASLSSCFTGIESTKKINLSREDKKNNQLSAEEKYMAQLQSNALKDWEIGKTFIVSDDKALLVLKPRQGVLPVAPDSIKGRLIEFKGVESKINAAGELTVSLLFSDGIFLYSYDTGKEFEEAMDKVMSDQIPMLIDADMVEQAKSLLLNQKLWTRTSLWYDENENRIDGRKFVEVKVAEVLPGNMIFPLKLKIIDSEGNPAFIFMNMGSQDNESRTFHNLFSLTDIRKHYPYIDSEIWDLITRGKVKEGMTKEEVKLSLGNPKEVTSGHDYSQTLDIWTFDNGRVLWFEDGRLAKIRQ